MRWEIDRSFPHTVFLQIYLWMLFSLVSMHGKGKQLIIIIESVQKKKYCSSLKRMWWCVFFFVCVFLHCNEQVAWMKCSLSSGVVQLYFFLPLLIRVINRVDSGIIERKGKNEIHGNMNANCSLQSLPFEGHNITCNRYLRCEETIIFSTWTKHLFINISCEFKETACYSSSSCYKSLDTSWPSLIIGLSVIH